ncbi:MAG: hypothetical protein DCC65_08240 [Planctomycetota bacterium]|nr:MAG: hypothetical protein DCC65_08240 [Planctomycetota bacterium]
MADQRRSLTEGLQQPPPADTKVEKAFVFGKPAAARPNGAETPATQVNRAQLSTRIRDDYFRALKRASLERQMDGVEPSTIVEIIEEALEPWLKSNGYLR